MDHEDESKTGFGSALAPPAVDGIELARVRAEVTAALFGKRQKVRLGRFELRGRIGSGGMGVVYAGYDPSLDRSVALKVLEPTESDERSHQRLLREAQALARLSHPHVVGVHEVGSADGRVFIAMELVEGDTLDVWLAREHPPLARVLEVLRDVGSGILAAHDRGLIHRDIKPNNVVVDPDGRARLIDFGLARAETKNADSRPFAGALAAPLTHSGALMGTPAYASPEQLRGLPADFRSDQYSFAATAWEAVTGAPPFAGQNVRERLQLIRDKVFQPPPDQAPRALLAALERALLLEPSQRYPSVAELIEALTVAENPPAEATRTAGPTTTRGLRRSTWRARAIAGIALAIATVVLVREWRRARADPGAAGAVPARSLDPTLPTEKEPPTTRTPLSASAPRSASASPIRAGLVSTQARDSNDECAGTLECSTSGRCTSRGRFFCVAGSDSDCMRSANCKKFGHCARRADGCVPTTSAHCRASSQCKGWGMCTLVGNRCAANADADCRASTDCKTKGMCTLADGWCLAKSDADCAASQLCAIQGRCRADRAQNQCVK